MKRLIPLLLSLLLLCGCGTAPVQETNAAPTQAPTYPAVDPTEPGGSYDPDSAVEKETAGAVRAYTISISGAYGMACMGEDVVVFSGADSTTLTKVSGENLYVTAAAHLDRKIDPEDTSVSVSEKGVSYYSRDRHAMVLLDTSLKEVGTIPLPEDVVGEPLMTADRKYVYYCTAGSVRELTVETGISRMLKEMTYPVQRVESVLLGGTVLECSLSDGDDELRTLFLSTEYGQTLWEGEGNIPVTGYGDAWYAILPDGVMDAFVYGGAGMDEQMLIPEDFTASGIYLEAANCLVTVSSLEDPLGVELNCYDLATGLRTSALLLEGSSEPLYMDVCESTGEIFVLCQDLASGHLTLYRWDPAALPTGDELIYSGHHYTLENPDTEGLAECTVYAQHIGSQYGVEVLIGADAAAVSPWNYALAAEYQVPVLKRELAKLDQLLSVYPEGMLRSAAAGANDGVMRICLVRQITGTPESGSLETTGGVCYWADGGLYIALAMGQDMQSVLYHEMYHALENRLLSDSDACYDWEYLNPDGFDYDYNYTDYLTREDSPYLADDTRYFINAYSMTFPAEDRAMILEYAMEPGNEAYFQTDAMQAKLKAICVGIREAYGLEKSPETFLWEQYLSKSLAYNK